MIIWLVMLVLWLPQSWLLPPSCLNITVPNKRYFQYNGSLSNITIGTSDKVTHNVTSNILFIILKEVLGYSDVKIVFGGDSEEMYYLRPIPLQTTSEPRVMINLEIWKDIDTQLPEHAGDIEEIGNVSPLGRFGWFVRNDADVTWLSFKHLIDSQRFSLMNSSALHLYCDQNKCTDVFVPAVCLNTTLCAVLLVDHLDWVNNSPVIHHIIELKLFVRVRRVVSLATVVSSLPEDVQLLVLAWDPAEVTSLGQWYPVAFPACNYVNFASAGCQYSPKRLLKYVSRSLSKGALAAYETVRNLELKRSEQMEILRQSVHGEQSHYDLACQYLLNNNRYKFWANKQPAKLPLRICGIFPLENVFQTRFSALGLPSAAELAVNHVNSDERILPFHELRVSIRNGQCNAERVMNTFIDYVLGYDSKELVGILGPACSDSLESLVSLTTHFRTTVISYSAEGSILSISDRNKYPYFFRTIGENLAYQQVYLRLLQNMNFKRMGALTEDSLKYSEYLTHLHNLLRENGIGFENLKFVQSHVNASLQTYIKDLQARHTRIIVADVHDAAARAVMCEAYRQDMTSKQGYIWFLPNWLSQNWYDVDKSRNFTHETVGCTTKEMKQAIQGYFSLSHRQFAPNDTWLYYANTTVDGWRKKYMAKLKEDNVKESSVFAGYVYDAVWTYAIALDQLYRNQPSFLDNIHTLNATQKYVEYLQNTNFTGVSGDIKFANGGPSRTSVIEMLEWYDGEFHVVGTYNDTVDQLFLNKSTLQWFTDDKRQPEDWGDGSCALQKLADALGTSCTGAIVTANVLGLVCAAVVVLAAVAFYKRKYEKRIVELEMAEKYMKQLGFDLIPLNSDLDKWEIARDSVVINRKLGEGAFGTVYGGEALIADHGWVAAAVKTLKTNATTEEKLDFLGEAEIMKRFDHKNIVKLVGVCTRNEPVYTIMEFMLYGDLKSFLQNRRHVVMGRHTTDETNEVSSKRLTSFALDIARGLSYLSSMKYVHRDLACRNCLLNSAKVAKIGDFGLTRRMYESDYYKFSRKGMLPIRWMSPESLADGLFTSKSDVWAFAVVVYEIVTFGSYPFPGLSNNEVMEYVKSGNTIAVPKGAKSQLEGLLKSCWNLDKDRRPDPSDLVVFLASNPRALTPCLEGIPTNVGLEPELLDRHLSAPVSPFDVAGNFFADMRDENEGESSRTSPVNFTDNAMEALLPGNRTIQVRGSSLTTSASGGNITSDFL